MLVFDPGLAVFFTNHSGEKGGNGELRDDAVYLELIMKMGVNFLEGRCNGLRVPGQVFQALSR